MLGVQTLVLLKDPSCPYLSAPYNWALPWDPYIRWAGLGPKQNA